MKKYLLLASVISFAACNLGNKVSNLTEEVANKTATKAGEIIGGSTRSFADGVGEGLDKEASANEAEYEEKCKHSSQMENLATSAERDSIKYMQIKYMEDHKDQEFLGVISGVTEYGIYVEIIENKCEGMVRARDMKDDYYVFDEKAYALIGEVSKKRYTLGDEVWIRVKNTDLIKRHLDFELVK